MQLRWRDLGRDDVPKLQQFSCAYPRKVERFRARKPNHPRPFQVVVQSYLRNLSLPVYPPNFAVGGWCNDDLQAVISYALPHEEDHFPGYFVRAFARDNRCHGEAVSDQGMAELLRRLRLHNEALGEDPGVMCKVHVDNRSAKAFVKRHGFELVMLDGSHGWWGRESCE